jgi:hypothetical protein
MDKCEVTVKKVRSGKQYFYRLILGHYESNKYFNHTFLKFKYLKSYAKRIGLNYLPLQKYVTTFGDHYYTELNASIDWQSELEKWYKEYKERC